MSNTPEQNKVAELMKPRYKVIADWPGVADRMSAGDVIISDGASNGFWVAGEPFTEGKLKDYPHLFKKLEWWHDRKPEEIDAIEYLKVLSTGDFVKTSNLVSGVYKNHLMNYQPATESEYDQYIKQNL